MTALIRMRIIDMSREAFEKADYATLGHSITSKNVLVEKETGRVTAVFYNDYDFDSVVERIAELEAENNRMREALNTISAEHFLFNEFDGLQTRLRMKFGEIAYEALNNNKG